MCIQNTKQYVYEKIVVEGGKVAVEYKAFWFEGYNLSTNIVRLYKY